MIKRRNFIQQAAISGLTLSSGVLGMSRLLKPDITNITVLHTNDWHSRIEPFPDDDSYKAGRGGFERRAAMVEAVRKSTDNVLLLDSGDVFQGTPYFNFYGGELEYKLMSELKYDATTMGNHDFDNGLDGLIDVMPLATFPLVISNYGLDDTPLAGRTVPHIIKQFGEIRIGVFGLGIELQGLVPDKLYGDTQYHDPIKVGQQVASQLKHDMGCDYVICLSHLGYKYDHDKVDDVSLARSTTDIDLILGGHTHTFLYEPVVETNLEGEQVAINQAGWGGLMLGRIDLYFENNRRGKCLKCGNSWV